MRGSRAFLAAQAAAVWTVVVSSGPVAQAADSKEAARSAAQELMAACRCTPGALVVIGTLDGPRGDALVDAFSAALLAALSEQPGVKVIDRNALKKVIQEAALAGRSLDGLLPEIAGGLGANVIIGGRVSVVGGDYFADLKATSVAKGEVLSTARAGFTKSGGELSSEATTLQAQLRRLADKLRGGLDALPGEMRYQRFAVMSFEEGGAGAQEKQLGLLVASELSTVLQRDHGLMIVERSQLARVVEELALGQTGLTDPKQTAEVGKLTGAQALVVGTVSDAGDRYLVNARIVSVDTGAVQYAEQTVLPAADLVALSSEAVVLRTRSGAVFRSVLLPGWGQFYNREPVKGSVFILAELAAVAGAATLHVMGTNAEKAYDTAADPAAQDRYVDQAESRYRWRNGLILTAVTLHLVNVLDAFINGKTFESATVQGGGAMGFRP